jgi:hypothetical protein
MASAPYKFTIAGSAARTTDFASEPITNGDNFPGVRVYIDVTDASATPSVTFSIQVKDMVGGDWASILTSAAQTQAITSPVVLEVAPGAANVANTTRAGYIGTEFRVISTASDSDSLTYSISGEWLGPVGY